MLKKKTGRLCFARLALLLAAAALAGCSASGGTTDDRIGRFLVSPDKYMIYNCRQLAEAITAHTTRERELEALMAKAGQGAGGSLVSVVGYRPDYMQVRGELYEMRRATAAKNCNVPGAKKPAAR